jgi:hypothetical protein
METTLVRLETWAGLLWAVHVPSPSCPLTLFPQANTKPAEVSAAPWVSPAPTALASMVRARSSRRNPSTRPESESFDRLRLKREDRVGDRVEVPVGVLPSRVAARARKSRVLQNCGCADVPVEGSP